MGNIADTYRTYEVDKRFNEWKVTMLSDNSRLIHIPKEREQQKKKVIESNIKYEWSVAGPLKKACLLATYYLWG